jgi:type IX secretion system PorP/SprF family membrane protein
MKNIVKYKIIAFLLVVFVTSRLNAQQMVRNNFYVQNPYVINPALSGFHGNFSAYFNYRDQWQGLHGAPQVAQLGIHAPVFSNMGLGLKVAHQTIGIFKETTTDLTWAYWMDLDGKGTLSLGASLGFKFSQIDLDEVRITNTNDHALYQGNSNESIFSQGLGVHYDYENFALNISLPTIYNSSDSQWMPLFYAEMSYDFFVYNDKWRIHPSLYHQLSDTRFNQFDVSVMAEWDNFVFGQVGYRSNKSIWLTSGVTLLEMGIMYSYEMNISTFNDVSSGSHEIMVYIDLKADKSPFGQNKFYRHHQKHRKMRAGKR